MTMTDRSKNLLKRLSEAHGIAGHEGEIRAIVEERLAGVGTVHRDRHGGIAVEKRGSADRPRILLAGHMDEIGFVVKTITDEGFIYMIPVGGWIDQVLLSQRFVVKGSKGKVLAVLGAKPPHLLQGDKRNEMVKARDMFLDVGASSKDEVTGELGILPGDPIVPLSAFEEMAGGKFLLGKAWDDRVGVALAVETALSVGDDHPNTIFAAGTVREEKSMVGAQVAAWCTEPDIAIILEVGITGGVPGVEPKEATEKCGLGVSIIFTEGGAVPSPELRAFARKVAEEEGIPFQDSFYEFGGSDGAAVHRHKIGVPYILLCVPARYIHTHNQLIATSDYEAALSLCVALCRRIDAKVLEDVLG